MLKKNTLFCLALVLISVDVFSQLFYKANDSIMVKENGNFFSFPFQGGFNAPQFNHIDLDMDSVMDLVIYDRSGGRVSPYLNKGGNGQIDYVYAPQYASAFPEINNWLYTRDYNCDGKMDLITGVRGASVWVYENVSNTSNGLAFQFVSRVRSTYFGNSFALNINPGGANLPGIADMNNDGDIDFIFFDSNGSQMEYHRNLSVEVNGVCGLLFEERSECWGTFTEAGFNSTVYLDSCRFGNAIPNPESGSGGSVRHLETKTSSDKRQSKHAGSAVALFDIDNSGSMDLTLGDIGSNVLTALYNNDSVTPYINSHIDRVDTMYPSNTTPVVLDVFPAAFYLDVNNDQKTDMLISTNSNGYLARSKYTNNMIFYENVGTNNNDFQYRQDDFLQGEVIDLGRGAYPVFFDFDNDGLMDMLVGNDGYLDSSATEIIGQLALFKNIGTASDPEFDLIERDFAGISQYNLDLTANKPQRFIVPTLGDIDGDGDDDLLLGDDDGRIHFFEDTSSSSSAAAFNLKRAAFQELNVFGRAAPALFDVDQDNLLDLIIGNSLGVLEYHKNLGTVTEPIYNLEVQSITWQYDSILRYQLRGNPDLSQLNIGQVLDINNALNGDNNVFQTIAAINNGSKYLDLIHPFTRSAIDDETNSTAVVDYSIKNWGGIRMNTYHNGDANATPFLYRDSMNDLKLMMGGWKGFLYFFDNIDSNITSGNFNLVDSIYTGKDYGNNSSIGGADLDGDGYLDIAVGNEAGGFQILMGSATTNLAENNAFDFQEDGKLLIYPNPAKDLINIQIPENFEGPYQLRVFDLSGRMVYQEGFNAKRNQLTQNLRAGLYMVEVAGRKRSLTAKLLVKP